MNNDHVITDKDVTVEELSNLGEHLPCLIKLLEVAWVAEDKERRYNTRVGTLYIKQPPDENAEIVVKLRFPVADPEFLNNSAFIKAMLNKGPMIDWEQKSSYGDTEGGERTAACAAQPPQDNDVNYTDEKGESWQRDKESADRLAYYIYRMIEMGHVDPRSCIANELSAYMGIGKHGPATMSEWVKNYKERNNL